jgi:diguanylate cyclase (GGDEF)-like protein
MEIHRRRDGRLYSPDEDTRNVTMTSTSKPASERGFKSLMASIIILLVLIAAPRLLLNHLSPAAGGLVNVLQVTRLWLLCLVVGFTFSRLIEMVLQRRIRRAWIHVMVWSALIPLCYGLAVYELERRWPGRGESELLLLTAMAVVTAFAGTMLKRVADSVTHTAHYDHLTGLPSRVLLRDKLERAIERAKRLDKKMAVCMFNIDRFKRINDSLGHGGGDVVLMHVAKQLQSVARPGSTVARIGGDEFVVMMEDLENPGDVERQTQLMLVAIALPVKVAEREVWVTASLGYCVYPEGATDAAGLLHHADAAMYEAKNAGRAYLNTYPPILPNETLNRMELEEDFRHALKNDELVLHYQPQIRLSTGEVTGLEALLRWNSPKRGVVPPAQFIAVAEEVGLMIPVGEWALQQVCRDGVDLQRATGRPLTMALNLSARQFGLRGLAPLVQRTLVYTGLAPNHLELEITEQMLMVNSPHTLETLQAIRDLGVGIAIDDFGTGFSSFAYILQYHVDRIKIDQTFIARSIDDPNATAVVRTIIAMAHGLNMRVVAEGVETLEQSEFLSRRRCDDAQGYLFARPMPKDEIAAAVARIGRDLRKSSVPEPIDLAAADFDMPMPARMYRSN